MPDSQSVQRLGEVPEQSDGLELTIYTVDGRSWSHSIPVPQTQPEVMDLNYRFHLIRLAALRHKSPLNPTFDSGAFL